MATFETGAVRSSDVDDVAFYLFSPIAMRRLARIYGMFNRKYKGDENCNQQHYIDEYYNILFYYLSGDRKCDYLAYAAAFLCEIIAIDNDWHRAIWGACSWSNIPPIALKKLALTYQEGKIKYVEYNCELGFPIYDLLNHSINHVNNYNNLHDMVSKHPDDIEIAHALWGLFTAMHSEEMSPHLNQDNLRNKDNVLGDKLKERIIKIMAEKYKDKK